MSVRTTLITNVSDLSDCFSSWNGLAQTPFQRPEWQLDWWHSFALGDRELFVLLTRFDDQLVGVTPMSLRQDFVWGRKLGFLGSGSACTDYQDVITEPGLEQIVAQNVADTLLNGSLSGQWDILELEGISASSQTARLLTEHLKSQNCIIQESPLENTWRLGIDQGWDYFLKQLAKTQQRQARNLVNRFEKNNDFEFEIVSEASNYEQALQDLIDLHQKRWTEAGMPGCFADPRFSKFVKLAGRDLIQQGLVKFYFLRSEGRRIAGSIAFLDRLHNLFIYQTGRDPSNCDQRVGQMLNLLIIRHCCELGIHFIDFLRGNEVYKERLRCEPIECSRIRCFANSLTARTRYNAWEIAKSIQRLVTTAGVALPIEPKPEEAIRDLKSEKRASHPVAAQRAVQTVT